MASVVSREAYHYFSGWPSYTRELVGHWMQARTVQVVEAVRAEPDPHLLVGYEQATLPRETDLLEWIVGQLLDALDSRQFASVPDGD